MYINNPAQVFRILLSGCCQANFVSKAPDALTDPANLKQNKLGLSCIQQVLNSPKIAIHVKNTLILALYTNLIC